MRQIAMCDWGYLFPVQRDGELAGYSLGEEGSRGGGEGRCPLSSPGAT